MSIYEEDNEYIDGDDKKPRLILIVGIIILIAIISVIVISCSINSKSDNSYLSGLRVSDGVISPNFSKDVTDYTVSANSDRVMVYCSAESTKANTSGCNKTIELTNGENVHKIVVTAQDKSSRTYSLTFKKADSSSLISVAIESDVLSGVEVSKELTLKALVLPIDSKVTYTWYKDNTIIDGEVSSTYVAKTSGDYSVKVENEEKTMSLISDVYVVNMKDKDTPAPSNPPKQNPSTPSNKPNPSPAYTLKINGISGNSSSWVPSVTLRINATASNGFAANAYSFDGGKSYQKLNAKTFTKNQNLTVVVKDAKGKTVSKSVSITRIDPTIPTVSISENSKTNTSVSLTAKVNPTTTASSYKYQWYRNNSAISGAVNSSYKVTQDGTYKVKVTTGAGKSTFSSDYKFNIIKVTCPTLSVATTSGHNVAPKTWYGEVVYMTITPSKETVNYDIYLNQTGLFNSVSNQYTYFNTYSGTIKLKISNGGQRVVKFVVRDKSGNSSTCYSNVYYLR